MKWLVILCISLASILAFAGIANAAVLCHNDSQVIMRLYGSSNTHGALWNQSYSTKICYDRLFSEPYNGSSPHDCTSGDVVLKLSGETNAHAGSSYSTKVCYGGLSDCTVESSGCPNGKSAVVYVSGTNNAHLWSYASIPIDSSYDAVCCRGESSPIPLSTEPFACYELDEESCNSGSGAIATSDPACPVGSSCRCVWNATQNICALEWGITSGAADGCIYKCVIQSSEQTECSGGSKILSLVATTVLTSGAGCLLSIPPEVSGCRSSSATVPCGDLEANLPFFGAWQILAGVAITMLVYALRNKRCPYS